MLTFVVVTTLFLDVVAVPVNNTADKELVAGLKVNPTPTELVDNAKPLPEDALVNNKLKLLLTGVLDTSMFLELVAVPVNNTALKELVAGLKVNPAPTELVDNANPLPNEALANVR